MKIIFRYTGCFVLTNSSLLYRVLFLTGWTDRRMKRWWHSKQVTPLLLSEFLINYVASDSTSMMVIQKASFLHCVSKGAVVAIVAKVAFFRCCCCCWGHAALHINRIVIGAYVISLDTGNAIFTMSSRFISSSSSSREKITDSIKYSTIFSKNDWF